jgi:hypothetical protein
VDFNAYAKHLTGPHIAKVGKDLRACAPFPSIQQEPGFSESPHEAFGVYGITYEPSQQNKSELYLLLLPVLNSEKAELVDVPRLVSQLCSLVRRTARGGRDSIGHPLGSHDDIANDITGAFENAAGRAKPLQIKQEVLARARQRVWPHLRQYGFT